MNDSQPSNHVNHGQLVLFGAPLVGAYFAMVLFIAYITKYATDVLLIAPAAVGAVFMLGRLWDAVSDPIVGYWSDRTKLGFGRRRPWMLGSALPIAVFFFMVWNPPTQLQGLPLVLWLGVAIFGLNGALTMFFVPHLALGAELSDDTHVRTRVFAVRQWVATIGTTLALVLGISALAGSDDPRATAFWLSVGIGVFCLATIVPASTPA